MSQEPDFAAVAALIGEPTRAAILIALLGGEALPASELAFRAYVTPQTASSHLIKLLDGGLLKVKQTGRHRYYSLKDHRVARLLETLQTMAPHPPVRPSRARSISPELRHARTCYDHLAGKLGVALTEAWVKQGYLVQCDHHYHLSETGCNLLTDWQIDVTMLYKAQRKFAFCCLDWSERRFHIAGAVGAAIASYFFRVDWIRRRSHSRALIVTGSGSVALYNYFGISLPPC